MRRAKSQYEKDDEKAWLRGRQKRELERRKEKLRKKRLRSLDN